jgi:hypothetical protein
MITNIQRSSIVWALIGGASFIIPQIQLASATQKNESEVSCVPGLYPECTY